MKYGHEYKLVYKSRCKLEQNELWVFCFVFLLYLSRISDDNGEFTMERKEGKKRFINVDLSRVHVALPKLLEMMQKRNLGENRTLYVSSNLRK